MVVNCSESNVSEAFCLEFSEMMMWCCCEVTDMFLWQILWYFWRGVFEFTDLINDGSEAKSGESASSSPPPWSHVPPPSVSCRRQRSWLAALWSSNSYTDSPILLEALFILQFALKQVTRSVLVLTLLAQVFKACFARKEAKNSMVGLEK